MSLTANKTRKPIIKGQKNLSSRRKNELNELILRFNEYMEVERGASRYTIRNYLFYLRRFYDWFIIIEPTADISKLDLEKVRKYRLYLSQHSNKKGGYLSKVTQSYHIIALRSLLKWLSKRDFSVLAADRIDLPKTESKRLNFLNKQQVERLLVQPLLSSETGIRNKAILEILFSTGLRVSELVSLDREQIDVDRREFGVIGKGGNARVVFLSKRAAYWLEKYLLIRSDKWKPLFIRHSQKRYEPTEDGENRRLSVRSIQRIVERYAKRAKLPMRITPHTLRHSFATDLLYSGAGLREVQEMLGHKNVATTQIYTHVTNPQLKKVHERFHSGNR